MSIAFISPSVTGLRQGAGHKDDEGPASCSASGRATANGRDEGFSKTLFHDSPEAPGHGTTIHTYPTLGESIGMAAKVGHGSCTDLPLHKR